MRRKCSFAYATVCTLLLAVGLVLAFYFAWQKGTGAICAVLVGAIVGFIVSPFVHELGHILFARATKMRCVYTKFFCFRFSLQAGKLRFSFASPFEAEQTQTLPVCGGNIRKRALAYTAGGLVFGGVFMLATFLLALFLKGNVVYGFWGCLPYAAYLFFLNVLPLEYGGGKTDALVYRGIRKGADVEKSMLAAMEIQGRLYEGASYAEIEESLYFDLPQLCEDEPMFVVMLDLRYRRYLETGNLDGAADCLNRLATAETCLSGEETEKIAAELAYMHALQGDVTRAENCANVCTRFLAEENGTAYRVLAAIALAKGEREEAAAYVAQAKQALQKEFVRGNAKFEEILLSRLALA